MIFLSKKPRLKVIDESKTGLNRKFLDTKTGKILTRGQVADNIDDYPDYHIMKKDGKRIIRSNPNKSKKDNLD
ncbi:hypothetical protein SAMN02745135_01163 [Caloranaerobacter azorensis DSM 13643]|uniref:DUF3892 domain-containing protein n=1 Tax=Caloranaerobacter azorensis DSM 13643 TaxID=1121264 RepID=A0A1M5TVM5_9FIRM|nr:hypothetical protein SAMN02745135_01163 [Caloranaerobacter azorensis DSM 13643]